MENGLLDEEDAKRVLVIKQSRSRGVISAAPRQLSDSKPPVKPTAKAASKASVPVGRTASGGKGGAKGGGGVGNRGGGGSAGAQGKGGPAKKTAKVSRTKSEHEDSEDDMPLTKIKKK